MPGVPPPPDFAHAKLEIETIPSGQTFGRIYWSTYPDPQATGSRRAALAILGVVLLPIVLAFFTLGIPLRCVSSKLCFVTGAKELSTIIR
jgi:hypothetical protein